MSNKLSFIKKHLDIIIAFISIVLMNQVLSRYFSQDVIWNDLVLESKILFLLENIKNIDLFNNIDYLYGDGLNRFSDIKNPIKFFDIGLILGLFINIKYALLIRFSVFALIASIFLSKIGTYFNSNKRLVNILTIFYITNPVFLSESSHLITFVFYFLPPIFYYSHRYYQLNSNKDLFKSLIFSFLLGSHTDIHSFIFSSFFILSPLIFFEINKQLVLRFLKNFILTITILIINNILLIISIIENSTVTRKIGFSDYLSLDYLFGYISTIIPIGMQYSIYIFPFIPLMFLVKRSNNFYRFIFFILLSILFPFIISLFPINIPSTLRYHLSVIPLITIIFLIISIKKIDLKKVFIISLIISLLLFIVISSPFLSQLPLNERFSDFIVDYFKFNDSLRFIDFMYPFGFFLDNEFYRRLIICFVPLIIPLGIYFTKINPRVYYILISVYMIIIYQQRFITSSILVSKSINNQISLIENNISELVPVKSSLFYSSIDVFNDSSGRNDILMPFIHKRTNGIKKYNQWNYLYKQSDIEFYQKITGLNNDCCFYPPSIKNFYSNYELILSKNINYLISGDSLLNVDYLELVKTYSLFDTIASKDKHESLFGKLHLYKIKN